MHILVRICLDLRQRFDPLHLIQDHLSFVLAAGSRPDEVAHVGIGQVLILVGLLLLGGFRLAELVVRQLTAELEHLLVLSRADHAGLAQEGGGQGNSVVQEIDVILLSHGGVPLFLLVVLFKAVSLNLVTIL